MEKIAAKYEGWPTKDGPSHWGLVEGLKRTELVGLGRILWIRKKAKRIGNEISYLELKLSLWSSFILEFLKNYQHFLILIFISRKFTIYSTMEE
jgi:hypothetical protein